jgi:malonate-semialdehyde dehydrogenase (acetylating)/methylmalonate-semialdehyde dehydrogenase
MAVSAVVAVGEVGDALVAEIASRVAKLRVGRHDDPDADLGPVITDVQKARVERLVD